MEDGELVEQGNHQQLLARGGVYAALVSAQLSDKALPAQGPTEPPVREQNERRPGRTTQRMVLSLQSPESEPAP